MDAAARLFHSHGYNATGMNELISEADVAKRTFYKYFNSKTAVLKAYLEAFDEKLYQSADDYIDGIADPKEQLFCLFDKRLKIQECNGFLGCPFVKINAELGINDAEINELVRKSKSRLKALIEKLIKSANASGKLDDEELASLVFLLIEGALINSTIFKNEEALKIAKRLVAKLL